MLIIKNGGDLLFFLDADDIYEPYYLEEALNFYDRNNDCDFLFCAVTEFGLINREKQYCSTEGNLGFSCVATLYGSHYIGGPTSTLSVRRRVLNKILPVPFFIGIGLPVSAFVSAVRVAAISDG